jgi:SAM-dependent methyltransferase
LIEKGFYNRKFPVIKNYEKLLEKIYGPGWKVPDKSFTWQRPQETVDYFQSIHNYNRGANNEYWANYYGLRNQKVLPPEFPSQFAIFTLGLRKKFKTIVELGCGTARDSFFFAKQDYNVIAADFADSVVQSNTEQKKMLTQSDNINFYKVDFSNLLDIGNFISEINKKREGPICFYSRFFFHAIDLNTQSAVFEFLKESCKVGDIISCEFRIHGDQQGSKLTDKHYRRFVKPIEFVRVCHNFGFQVDYLVEGTGYANYGLDDARVCRIVFSKAAK